MNWTDFRLSTREMESVIRSLGINPDDLQAVVDNHEIIEHAFNKHIAIQNSAYNARTNKLEIEYHA